MLEEANRLDGLRDKGRFFDMATLAAAYIQLGSPCKVAKHFDCRVKDVKDALNSIFFQKELERLQNKVKDALDLQTIDLVEVLWDIAQNGERDTDKIGACRELKGYTGGFDNNVQKKEVKHDFEHMSDEELLEVWK